MSMQETAITTIGASDGASDKASESHDALDAEMVAERRSAQEIAVEIADIMSWDVQDTLREVEQEQRAPGSHVKAAWLEANPQTPAEIEAYYQTTTSYIYDLVAESARDIRQRWRAAVLEEMRRFWGDPATARILDYGAGVGQDSLYFAQHCAQVAYYDVPGVTSDFAAQRFQRHQVPIVRVSQTAAYGSEFDALVSFEVLEHIVDPQAHLDEMTRLVRPGGLLFLTESFELVNEDYPSHLESNRRYAQQLDALMAERGCQPLGTIEERIAVFVKGPPVSVLIPVYNATEQTRHLLQSIRYSNPGYPVRWLVIDDASPDPEIAPLLQSFAAEAPAARAVTTNSANAGFVATCNAGMRARGSDDVILLNSDTLVYDGWVRKLVEAAYAADDIATVTPLSNNASAYSVLAHIQPDNNMNQLLAASEREAIDVPTGVGFCLYIKREVLDKVGAFDLVFGRGYGEETEFCQRAAKLGYRHILTPNVFIYHKGSASMAAAGILDEGMMTIPAHEAIINRRYPGYHERVMDFIASGVIERLDQDLARAYVSHQSACRPSVALVVHTDPFASFIGGIEFHIRDIITDLDHEYIFYVVSPDGERLRVTASIDGVTSSAEWTSGDYPAFLRALNPSLIHVHHLMNHPPAFVNALTRWCGPKVFTIHDYAGLCPRYTLLNSHLDYCGVPAKDECQRCAARLFPRNPGAPQQRRRVHQRFVDSASLVLAPSQAALDVFARGVTLAPDRVRVVPNPSPRAAHNATRPSGPARRTEPARVTRESESRSAGKSKALTTAPARTGKTPRLTVGFIGYSAEQKGGHLVNGLIAECRLEGMRFVAIGEVMQSMEQSVNVVSTGLYERGEVIDMIREHGIDVLVITSPWPETFSYTLSEVWEAGVPAVVGPLGAPAERVAATGAGVVVPDYRVSSFATVLRALAGDPERLAALKRRVADVPLTRDFADFRAIYTSLTGNRAHATALFTAQHAFVAGRPDAARDGTPAPHDASRTPVVSALVVMRKAVFPVGSRREQVYFKLHNVVTTSYAGGVAH